jgi:predicted CoA-substrate-specific enzyme activase
MFRLGLDIGSRNTKLVVFDSERGSIVHSAWKETEISVLNSVNTLIAASLRALSISREDFQFCGVTGYGRKLYPGPASVLSEITCHAAGCKFIFPEVRTIIDIGGQDSKIITLDQEGKVLDFAMNDKCAAGTGRFLEMTALRLGCEVGSLSSLAHQASRTLKLNSTCVVFAESEIIGMMSQAFSAEDIAHAVHLSIARRISSQMAGLAWREPIVFTGGVAQNPDLATCLGNELGYRLSIPPDPEITGALGAAILAK